MNYRCVDIGSSGCPCVLMEAGQCYACTLGRTGKCDCSADWQGVCPYNEFLQWAENPAAGRSLPQEFYAEIMGIKNYSEQLAAVRLAVSRGFAWRCRKAGSFITASALGCRVPLSVMCTGFCYGKNENEGGVAVGGWIEIAVQPAGPKTGELLKKDMGNVWKIAGPFEAGLLNVERLNLEEPLTVIAKGTAIAPFINIMYAQSRDKAYGTRLLIDTDKLTDDFLEDYLGNCTGINTESGSGKRPWERVSLAEDTEKILSAIDDSSQIMLLASPYYTEKYSGLRSGRKGDIITANHANMCCGAGICGACSFTDADGITVRRCKCV